MGMNIGMHFERYAKDLIVSKQGEKANEKLVPYWLLHDLQNVVTSKTNEPWVDKSLLLLLFSNITSLDNGK